MGYIIHSSIVKCLHFPWYNGIEVKRRKEEKNMENSRISIFQTDDTYVHVAIKHPCFFHDPTHCLPRILFTVLHAHRLLQQAMLST